MRDKVKCLDAYLTVEASYLLPIAVVVTCFTVIYLFFMYNSCVVYQSCYISCLRGSQMFGMSTEDIKEKVTKCAGELLNNQIYEYSDEFEVEVGLFSINTKATSSEKNSLKDFDVVASGEMKVELKAEALRIDPIMVLRLNH